MDVGNSRFVFTTHKDGKEEKDGKPIRSPAQAELVIDSLDRFHDQPGGVYTGQSYAKLVNAIFSTPLPSNNFTIRVGRNLLYGYFHRLAITQIQVQLRLPTVITGYNDKFLLGKNNGATVSEITIPAGYYTPTTLAAALQTAIRAAPAGTAGYTVTYSTLNGGFAFATNTADTTNLWVANFPPSVNVPESTALIYYKCARLLGAGRLAFGVQSETAVPPVFTPQTSFSTFCCNFFPTDYLDICSQTLTRYKRVKDANSTDAGLQNIVARVYLNPPDTVQQYTANTSPNSAPSVLTVEYKTPDAHKWSAEEALQNIDFQVYDMYGDLMYWNTENNTEFQITLLASES